LQLSTLLFIGTVALGAAGTLPVPAHAVALGRADVAPPSDIVQVVDHRCGEHMHYVRAHQAKDGHLIRGHCARDKHL
jgi:hypothetical protein